jgi:hypothetical protein
VPADQLSFCKAPAELVPVQGFRRPSAFGYALDEQAQTLLARHGSQRSKVDLFSRAHQSALARHICVSLCDVSLSHLERAALDAVPYIEGR